MKKQDRYYDEYHKMEEFKSLLESAKQRKNSYDYAFACYNLSSAYLHMNRYQMACQFGIMGSKESQKNHYDELLMHQYNILGIAHSYLSQEQYAIDYYLKALSLAEQYESYFYRSSILNNMGILYLKLSQHTKAMECFDLGYQICQTHITNPGIVLDKSDIYHMNRTILYSERGRLRLAKKELSLVSTTYQQNHVHSYQAVNYYLDYKFKKMRQNFSDMVLAILSLLKESKQAKEIASLYQYSLNAVSDLIKYGSKEEILKGLTILYRMTSQIHLSNFWVQYYDLEIEALKKIGMTKKLNHSYDQYLYWCEKEEKSQDKVRYGNIDYSISYNKILMQNEKISMQNRSLEIISRHDVMTGFYNRLGLKYYESSDFVKRRAEKLGFGCAILDIDYFKQYNDTYGHYEGDECIRKICRCLRDNMSERTFFFRYGGDEVLLILEDTSFENFKECLERIRKRILALSIPHKNSLVDHFVTVTIGGCYLTLTDASTLTECINRADHALYEVKQTTRNAVKILE